MIVLMNLILVFYLVYLVLPEVFNRLKKFLIIAMKKIKFLQKANNYFNK